MAGAAEGKEGAQFKTPLIFAYLSGPSECPAENSSRIGPGRAYLTRRCHPIGGIFLFCPRREPCRVQSQPDASGGGSRLALSAGFGPDRGGRLGGGGLVGNAQAKRGLGRSPPFLRKTAFAGAEEISQVENRAGGEFQPQRLKNVLPSQTPPVDDPVSGLEVGDVFARVTAAPEPHHIEPYDTATLAIHQHVRGHILHHPCVSTHHGESADPAKLMNGHSARDEGPVLNLHVSAEHGAIGENTVVSHHNIVTKMPARHHVVIGANKRLRPRLECPVHGYMLAKNIVISQHNPAGLAGTSDVLWGAADDRVLTEFIVAASSDARLDVGAGRHRAEVTKHHICLDGSKRPYRHACAKLGVRAHGSQRMDAHCSPSIRLPRGAGTQSAQLGEHPLATLAHPGGPKHRGLSSSGAGRFNPIFHAEAKSPLASHVAGIAPRTPSPYGSQLMNRYTVGDAGKSRMKSTFETPVVR